MADDFKYDVFLSHSSKDKAVVGDIAERLRKDGLRVWFDESRDAAKLEAVLAQSRAFVLCLSMNALGSDWVRMESDTFPFRDSLSKDRRFVPLRLDDAPIKGSLARFLYIDWRVKHREQAYPKLLEACRPPAKMPSTERETSPKEVVGDCIWLDTSWRIDAGVFSQNGKRALSASRESNVRLWNAKTGKCLRVFRGHTDGIASVAWSGTGQRALSGSDDQTVRLWDVETGSCLRIFDGHTDSVVSVALSGDGHRILSGSIDNTMRLWDVQTGRCLRVFEGHTGTVRSVAWSEDAQVALSGSYDNTARLWDVETGRCLQVLQGHSGTVWSVALSGGRGRALSGSWDRTVRLWDMETGRCLRILEGHTERVWSVAWSMDGRHALSGSFDGSVRLWDVETGGCHLLEGHTDFVWTVAWGKDGHHVFSGDASGGIMIRDLSEFVASTRAPGALSPDQVQYTNAKVLLVGDSGVGKTGLANYLALGTKDEERLTSTDGAWATRWLLPHTQEKAGVDREIWLWDFAGQLDYRLIHQLFMDDTAVAVLVFNPQDEKLFDGLGKWDRDLQKSSRKAFAKLLVAGRVDCGGLVVSRASMERFMKERGFPGLLRETSAKTGEGCDELGKAIVKAIDWQGIPETASPALYHRMKQEILRLRDSGVVLIRLSELKQRMEMSLRGESFDPAELEAVVGLLAGPGMIKWLDFGGFIMLRPEVLSRYAAAVVRKVRKHPDELGCIREDEMLTGALDYQGFQRLPAEDESVVLKALQETFISRAWCLRQPCEDSALLIFPSYFRRERPEQPTHPSVLVTYRFTGPVEDIYATLVVRLHHTVAFEKEEFWKLAADFKTQMGQSLGLRLTPETEGTARLEVYFAPEVDENSRVIFLRYVHNHLIEHAQDVVRLRHYFCANKRCPAPHRSFADQALVDSALASGGTGKVFCPACGKAIELRDTLEEKFDSLAVKEQVREMEAQGDFVIDTESRELLAVHHAGSIVSEAGQIYRGIPNSDHGIDAEIEFKDDRGRATGKRLYLQLKSGDSYLRKRQRDGAEVFQIKQARWAEYWQAQAYPVLLVIRNSDGEIRWMDVSSYLKRESEGGKKAVKQIVFEGERFDVMSVRRWREKALSPGP